MGWARARRRADRRGSRLRSILYVYALLLLLPLLKHNKYIRARIMDGIMRTRYPFNTVRGRPARRTRVIRITPPPYAEAPPRDDVYKRFLFKRLKTTTLVVWIKICFIFPFRFNWNYYLISCNVPLLRVHSACLRPRYRTTCGCIHIYIYYPRVYLNIFLISRTWCNIEEHADCKYVHRYL